MDFRCSPNNIDPIIRGDSAGNKILAGAYRILAVWNCIPTVSLRLPGRSATPPASEELLSMKLGDFAHSNKTDYVTITGKNKKTRNTPLSEKAKMELNSYIKKFHPDGNPGSYLFFTTRNGSRHKMSSDNLARIMLKYERLLLAKHPDLPHLHPHLWRHTRAQNLYDAGMPLEIVSAWLGHSQLESTLIYSSIGLERKRKALQNATQGEDSLLGNGCPKYCDDENLIKQLYGLK